MKKITFSAEYTAYTEVEGLAAVQQNLLHQAKAACETAYAPYSNFKVGAAALLANGEIVRGSNQENASFPLAICGERNALFAAAARFPGVAVQKVAITVQTLTGDLAKPITPCGACRQVLFEFEQRGQGPIELILQGDRGEILVIPAVKDILPLSFDASFL